MSLQSDPLFQEIDEAVKRDRIAALVKQYRKPVLCAAAAILIFTLGLSQWRQYQERVSGAALEDFAAAQQNFAAEKYSEATAQFAAIAAHPRSHEVEDMAKLWQARSLLAQKKDKEALPILKALADQPKSKQRVWADLACLRLAALDATQASCLGESVSSPLAAERKLTHAAQRWDSGKPEAARAILSALLMDPTANPQIRSRAQAFLSVLPPESAPEEKK